MAKENGTKKINDMKGIWGFCATAFTLTWNLIDWQNINIIFTCIISVLTIIYLVIKIWFKIKEQKKLNFGHKGFIKRLGKNKN